MASNSIFKATYPDPVRIFGLQLLPFSFGRYRLLKRFDSPFVADSESKADTDDLITAILVCALPCNELIALLENAKKARNVVKAWGKRILKEIRADKHFNVFAKFGLFRKYLDDATALPKYWDEQEGGGGSSGAHWSQTVEVVLRSELGYTSHEIDEGPMGKALGDYFKWAESQGLIRLVSEEELAQAQENEKVFAELAKKFGGQNGP